MHKPFYEFNLSPYHLELLDSIYKMSDSFLVVSHIFDPQRTLADLSSRGVEYIVTLTGLQANVVLRELDVADLAFMRDGKPALKVYEIRYDLLSESLSLGTLDISGIAARRRNVTPEGWGGEALRSPPPEEHWIKNLNAYPKAWAESWWREAIQNSRDACKEAYEQEGRRGTIKCTRITNKDKNTIIVQVEDNGVGMDLDTLTTAFLTLGGSAKRGKPGAVGGLGMAKELLIHAWGKWVIHTRTKDQRPSEAYWVQGKYNHDYYPIYKRRGKEDIPDEHVDPDGFERWIGEKARPGVGTTISVNMSSSNCVRGSDLERFLQFSDIPNITISYRESVIEGGVRKDEEWITIKANNKITPEGALPVKVLRRKYGIGAGSVWAKVYHSPKAQKNTEVAIRVDGLFMFTAPGQYAGITGKVIIELEYIPKNSRFQLCGDCRSHFNSWIRYLKYAANPKRWKKANPTTRPPDPIGEISEDCGCRTWISFKKGDRDWEGSEEEQKLDTYGPLELLGESRTEAQDNWPNFYSTQLESFLDLLKQGKKVLKKKRPPRIIRAKNAPPNIQKKPWAEIFTQVEPQKLLEGDTGSIDRIAGIRVENVVKILTILADQKREGEMIPAQAVRAVLTDNQIARAQQMEDLPPEIKEIVRQPGLTINIDTSADFEFWSNEIMPIVLQDALYEGKGDRFISNAIKFLNWEPDFILNDEVEMGFPKAPKQWDPSQFGSKEKRLAKFWIEVLRLCFILSSEGERLLDRGEDTLGLQAGFLFQNPQDEVEAFFDRDEALGRYSIAFPPDKEPIRAIYLTPAELDVREKASSWKHRYRVAVQSKHRPPDDPKGKEIPDRLYLRDFSVLTSIAFHEMGHALHSGSGEGEGHDTEFASIVTHRGIAHAHRYGPLFRKILNYIVRGDKYVVRGSTRTGRKAPKSKIQTQKPEKFRGFYEVRIEGRKGRKPRLLNLRDAYDNISDYFSKKGAQTTEVVAYYWDQDEDGEKIERHLSRVAEIYTDQDLAAAISNIQSSLEKLNEKIEDETWMASSRSISGSDQAPFSRRLRRRNPEFSRRRFGRRSV